MHLHRIYDIHITRFLVKSSLEKKKQLSDLHNKEMKQQFLVLILGLLCKDKNT